MVSSFVCDFLMVRSGEHVRLQLGGESVPVCIMTGGLEFTLWKQGSFPPFELYRDLTKFKVF